MAAILVALTASAWMCLPPETDSAEKLIEAGHWKRARAVVERRLGEAPADPHAIFLLSQIRYAFGDRSSPLPLAEKAVRLDPRVAKYHRQLAETQGILAQHAGVFQQILLARRFRREIDTALQLDPADAQALRDLMEFYLLAPGVVGGDAAKAGPIARRIAAIDASEGYLAEARLAEFRRDRALMATMLSRAAEVRPASYKAQMALARFYLSAPGREESAETLCREAIHLDCGRAEAYALVAEIYAARADWSALEAVLASAAQAVPDDASPQYRAAERLLTAGRDPARAARYLREYLAREIEGAQPPASEARSQLGRAEQAIGGLRAN